MAKKQVAEVLRTGDLVVMPGGRVGEWVSRAGEGTTHRTEHFRTVDSLALLLRHGSITHSATRFPLSVTRSPGHKVAGFSLLAMVTLPGGCGHALAKETVTDVGQALALPLIA